jgi:hypothetical protein
MQQAKSSAKEDHHAEQGGSDGRAVSDLAVAIHRGCREEALEADGAARQCPRGEEARGRERSSRSARGDGAGEHDRGRCHHSSATRYHRQLSLMKEPWTTVPAAGQLQRQAQRQRPFWSPAKTRDKSYKSASEGEPSPWKKLVFAFQTVLYVSV